MAEAFLNTVTFLIGKEFCADENKTVVNNRAVIWFFIKIILSKDDKWNRFHKYFENYCDCYERIPAIVAER
jgi:hypothetical protein